MQNNSDKDISFLDHVAELRMHIIRSIIGVVVGSVVVSIFWKYFNYIIIAPLSSDFITFRWFNALGHSIGVGDLFKGPFDIVKQLTNLSFSGQFSSLIGVVLVGGILVALPYIVYEIYKFLKPGLTAKERKYSSFAMLATILFFLLGVAFSYFLVLPLSIHFMFFFQPFEVSNNWTLASYISVFVQTTLAMGVVFLLPIIVYFLVKIDLITPQFLKTYRKHAFVVILSVAALITPADLLSMFIASLPLWVLYEFSIVVAKYAYKELPGTSVKAR